jgi:hypothetical protein
MAVHFKAKVKRTFVHGNGTSIRLEGKGNGYFELSNEHPQYNALYSLALVAAVNNHTLWIRTTDERDEVTDDSAAVQYMVIDW